MFCFGCKIFGESNEKSAFVRGGFSDWKHAGNGISEHETSNIHRKAMVAYINQAADSGTVDSKPRKQFDEECEFIYILIYLNIFILGKGSTEGCYCCEVFG